MMFTVNVVADDVKVRSSRWEEMTMLGKARPRATLTASLRSFMRSLKPRAPYAVIKVILANLCRGTTRSSYTSQESSQAQQVLEHVTGQAAAGQGCGQVSNAEQTRHATRVLLGHII